jgi:hypothetical protein
MRGRNAAARPVSAEVVIRGAHDSTPARGEDRFAAKGFGAASRSRQGYKARTYAALASRVMPSRAPTGDRATLTARGAGRFFALPHARSAR